MKINFHIYESCNMNCIYCFRNKKCCFKLDDKWKEAIDIISLNSEIDWINIAGGEPTLNPKLLLEILEYIKSKNIKISIISNGSIFSKNHEFLLKVLDYVEYIGLSIDSFNTDINNKIGRKFDNDKTLSFEDVKQLTDIIHSKNKKIKINVVVSKYNYNDETLEKIKYLSIDKLKILKNQNDQNITKEMCLNLSSKFENIIEEINVEFDMSEAYIMLDADLNLSSSINGSKKSIFEKNVLDMFVSKIKNHKNYAEKITNYSKLKRTKQFTIN